MMDRWARERQVALAALRGAAALCARVRATESPATLSKSDRSPVTVADYGAQAIVCRALQRAFPADAVVAEEDAANLDGPQGAALLERATRHVGAVLAAEAAERAPHAPPTDAAAGRSEVRPLEPAVVRAWIARGATAPADPSLDRFWVLDPIDGTKGFLRGDQYAIALALVEGGRVRLGLLACPALARGRDGAVDGAAGDATLGVIVEAVEGAGARLHPLTTDPHLAPAGRIEHDVRTLHVAQPDEPASRRFVESVEGAHGDPERQQAVARATGIDAPPLRLDSQVKYAAVADGRAALYLRLPSPNTPDYREKIWDHAAGALIVQEAGGRVTDAAGRDLDMRQGRRLDLNRGIVAGAPAAQRAAVAALAALVTPQTSARKADDPVDPVATTSEKIDTAPQTVRS
jgi:3'(2'), 5'-bisphosphate nucleotidase